MTRYIILGCLLVMVACNSKKNEPTVSNHKKDLDSAVVKEQKDAPFVVDLDTSGVDKANFGPIKLGQYYRETQEVLGPPDTKSKPIEWAADGMLHEDWTWKKNGLVINMSSDKEIKDATIIHTITATSPCTFKTKAGLGIGSSYAEVQEAYKNNIDPEATDKTQITVGSVYDGIIFSFKNDKVNQVFLGAQAE